MSTRYDYEDGEGIVERLSFLMKNIDMIEEWVRQGFYLTKSKYDAKEYRDICSRLHQEIVYQVRL